MPPMLNDIHNCFGRFGEVMGCHACGLSLDCWQAKFGKGNTFEDFVADMEASKEEDYARFDNNKRY